MSRLKIGIASADYMRPSRSYDGLEHWGGSGWARIAQYIPYLRAAGHQVAVGTFWGANPATNSTAPATIVDEVSGERMEPDLIILQRLMHDLTYSTKVAQSHGQIVVHDVDDWYWGLDPKNAAFKAAHPKENPEENVMLYKGNLAAADYVIVSTPYLRGRLAGLFNGTFILQPNYVDVKRFRSVEPMVPTGIMQWGWAGSTAHRSGDLETVKGVFRPRILDGMKFVHAGHNPQSPWLADIWDVPAQSIQVVDMVGAEDYPKILGAIDVGIVPLRNTPFNWAKSDIKGLEYAASGIPFIAQDSPAYKQLHEDWDGAFWLADRPNAWVKGIKHYEDTMFRQASRDALLDLVWKRDLELGAQRFVSLIEDLTP